jgi:hypothetical protein
MRLMGVKVAMLKDEGARHVSDLMTAEAGLSFPTYTQGVLEGGVEALKAPKPRVEMGEGGSSRALGPYSAPTPR